jgi:predicted acylesterase/phospholipase RssA
MPMIARLMLLLALFAAGPVGCAGVLRTPTPKDLTSVAEPLGMKGLRQWGDSWSEAAVEEFVERYGPVLQRLYGPEIAAGRVPRLDFLALSGGGQFGAFGAGILDAWTKTGQRPEFHGVAGVSTGAIIAPFAFLGSDYDHVLREIYSKYDTNMLIDSTILSGLLSGTALSSTSRLARVIDQYVDAALLERIAEEHRKGRLLFIGTTNLDAGRPVIWDIGAIAASGKPGALGLMRQLIRASAAIPVAFPPVFVDVFTPDGRKFDEMHVDGGASSQVTFISPDFPLAEVTRRVLGRNLDRRLWVIVNNDLEPPYAPVKPRIGAIGGAAVSSLIRGSGIGDTYRLFAIARRDEVNFNVAWIPATIPCPDPTEVFDRPFMECLFKFGGDYLNSGRMWHPGPPFFAMPPPPQPARARR